MAAAAVGQRIHPVQSGCEVLLLLQLGEEKIEPLRHGLLVLVPVMKEEMRQSVGQKAACHNSRLMLVGHRVELDLCALADHDFHIFSRKNDVRGQLGAFERLGESGVTDVIECALNDLPIEIDVNEPAIPAVVEVVAMLVIGTNERHGAFLQILRFAVDRMGALSCRDDEDLVIIVAMQRIGVLDRIFDMEIGLHLGIDQRRLAQNRNCHR